MQTSSVIKVISAFVAGVILSMGGAMIYSRTRDLMYPVRIAKAAAPAIATEDVPAPQSLANQEARSIPAPQEHAAQGRVQLRESRPARVLLTPPKAAQKPLQGRVQKPAIAQNTAVYAIPVLVRSAPSSAPAAAPIVNSAQPTAEGPAKVPKVPPITTPALNEQHVTTPRREPQIVTLPTGTALMVKLTETLSTDRNVKGDTFRGTLDAPVIANGFVIADRGSLVVGRIVELQRAHLVRGASDIALSLAEINTTDGQRIPVNTLVWEKSGSKLSVRDTPKMAVGAAFGAVVGALSGAAKGAGLSDGFGNDASVGSKSQRAVVIPMDFRLTFTLARSVRITEHLNYR